MEVSSVKFRMFYGIFMTIYFIRIFMNSQNLFTSSATSLIDAICVMGAAASMLFVFNVRPHLSALAGAISILLIWYLSPLIYNIGIGYFGFGYLLLSIGVNQKQISKEIDLSLAIVMSFALTYSGLSKIINPIWRSGDALIYISKDPLFNWSLSSIFTENLWLSRMSTVSVLTIELVAFLGPLLPNRNLRKLLWWSQLILYFGIFIFFEFRFTIIGLMLLHLGFYKNFCKKGDQLFNNIC